MSMAKAAYRLIAGNILNNPSASAGGMVFVLGFSLVAGNALFSQPRAHPDPIWQTTDRTVTRSVVENVSVVNQPVSITRSVLTQRISLKNIPVPTASPARIGNNAPRSELVREFQDALLGMGLYEGKVDGIYGSGTKNAIIAYQQNAGILPDGEASYELLAHIQASSAAAQKRVKVVEAKPTPVAKPLQNQGQVSIQMPKTSEFDRDTILRIQAGLKEKFGETAIDVDGVYGSQTRNALMRFQEFFQLEPSGEIDRKTMEKLLSAGIIQAI